MSLTGLPLIVLVIVLAVGAVVATVLLWNRFGRARHVVRVSGVLLAEALTLLTFGLFVNRAQEFYPTWGSLVNTAVVAAPVAARVTATGALDRTIAAHATGRTAAAQSFAWQTSAWKGWGLAAAPTVVTPAGYLQHPGWTYSAVVVLGSWTAAQQQAALKQAGTSGAEAVVVFATASATTTARTIADALPAELVRDIRVSDHHWAVVTSAADTSLAHGAIGDAAARFPSLAVATTGGTPAAVTVTDPALPAGVASSSGTFGTALAWAVERTAAPLAAAAPQVTYVAPQHYGRH